MAARVQVKASEINPGDVCVSDDGQHLLMVVNVETLISPLDGMLIKIHCETAFGGKVCGEFGPDDLVTRLVRETRFMGAAE